MRKRSKLEEECSSSSSRVYKLDKHENVGEDIISNLPQDILHHIFTFLDMKQTIQTTCLLSRRWRYFWVSIPILKFTYIKQTSERNKFLAFVDRVLMFRGNSNIHEFKIVAGEEYIRVPERTINTWILASVIRNAQQITLDIQFPLEFHFHHCLFSSKSLTKLVVRDNRRPNSYGGPVVLSLPDSITLPNLKTLSLHLVQFKDEDPINHLFSSCPILESLTINMCEIPHINVNISSPLLQHLELSNCSTASNEWDMDPVPETNFQLCAPNLRSFYWCNAMSKHCAPKNLSSLVKADIDVFEDYNLSEEKKAMYAPFMVNILRGLHNVEDLTLSTSFLEVIRAAPDLFDSQPTKFGNLTCLKLTGIWRSLDCCIHGILYLLKNSPNIETLSIEDWSDFMNAATGMLNVKPTQFCNLRCLRMHTVLSRNWIYAIACLLKICPDTETLSHTVNHEDEDDDEMYPYWDEINYDPTIKRDYWEAGLSLECLLNHLKCFELRGMMGRIIELEFIEILLKNGMLLETLLIIFQKTYSVDVDEERRRVKFIDKVLTFPRATSSVVILFK